MEYLLAYLNESNGFKFGKLFQFKGTLDRKSFFIGGLAWIHFNVIDFDTTLLLRLIFNCS